METIQIIQWFCLIIGIVGALGGKRLYIVRFSFGLCLLSVIIRPVVEGDWSNYLQPMMVLVVLYIVAIINISRFTKYVRSIPALLIIFFGTIAYFLHVDTVPLHVYSLINKYNMAGELVAKRDLADGFEAVLTEGIQNLKYQINNDPNSFKLLSKSYVDRNKKMLCLKLSTPFIWRCYSYKNEVIEHSSLRGCLSKKEYATTELFSLFFYLNLILFSFFEFFDWRSVKQKKKKMMIS